MVQISINGLRKEVDMRMISPNDLHDAAKQIMLEGKDPVTDRDWQLCVNFWSTNVSVAEIEICKLMKRIYNCPLSDEEIAEIATFQIENKKKKKGTGHAIVL
jgi:hypothetical protein